MRRDTDDVDPFNNLVSDLVSLTKPLSSPSCMERFKLSHSWIFLDQWIVRLLLNSSVISFLLLCLWGFANRPRSHEGLVTSVAGGWFCSVVPTVHPSAIIWAVWTLHRSDRLPGWSMKLPWVYLGHWNNTSAWRVSVEIAHRPLSMTKHPCFRKRWTRVNRQELLE